jgi:hypothetical protein
MPTLVVVGGYLSIGARLAWLLDLGIVFLVSSSFLTFSTSDLLVQEYFTCVMDQGYLLNVLA